MDIKKLIFCCQPCAKISGYLMEEETNVISNNKMAAITGGQPSQYHHQQQTIKNMNSIARIVQHLTISVIEVKDLPTSPMVTKNNMKPYCVVMLDDVKHAKTLPKVGCCAFWNETFTFKYEYF